MDELDTGWVSRWVVAQCEPLIDTAARQEIDDQMIKLVGARPHWFAAWLAGFLSDIVRSLDPQDPWRNLKIVDNQVIHPDGSPFGTWVDATDLVHASDSDLRADLGLAALAVQLDGAAGKLFVTAAQGWHETLSFCEHNLVTEATLNPFQARDFFNNAARAVRWAIYRRRLFMGMEDQFVPVSAVSWIARASKMVSGENWDEARAAQFLEGSKVPEGTYSNFA